MPRVVLHRRVVEAEEIAADCFSLSQGVGDTETPRSRNGRSAVTKSASFQVFFTSREMRMLLNPGIGRQQVPSGRQLANSYVSPFRARIPA